MKKITIIGRGTAGCVAVTHFLRWTDWEIDWVFDIEKLLNELISTGKRSIFIPAHWHFEPKRK